MTFNHPLLDWRLIPSNECLMRYSLSYWESDTEIPLELFNHDKIFSSENKNMNTDYLIQSEKSKMKLGKNKCYYIIMANSKNLKTYTNNIYL